MLSSFSIMLGSVVTGILWDKFGAAVPFLMSGGVSLLVAISLYFLSRKGQNII
jgi:predicted MFS family arabinose efflux permease